MNLFLVLVTILCIGTQHLMAQVGYYDAPYTRYEANAGTLNSGTIIGPSFNQANLESEASEQMCVNLFNGGSSVSWTVTAAGDGLVVRYSVPDTESGTIEVFNGATSMGSITLTSNWSWEYLSSNGNPNNVGVTNTNPKMRFDEVRLKMPSQIPVGGTLRLVRTAGNVTIDFAELEPVPAAVAAAGGDAIYDGSNFQTFVTNNGGRTIYVPAGTYNVGSTIEFANNNTTLKGAGMWYTQINFTNGGGNQGGLWSFATNVNFSGLYLTTNRNSRSSSYKALNGAFTPGTSIKDVWAIHFECGGWIANYTGNGPGNTNGLTISNSRFRNNYADGINLCKGTINTVVEHCSFRNNGDDDMAIWSANNSECRDNTFQYNTSENCWRSAGVAIYGGRNNRANNILIVDNLEVGIKVNNAFAGIGFINAQMHQFYNIIIKRCGTQYDLFGKKVGAIEMGVYNNGAGTDVQNVKFSCIQILDSKHDAINMHKETGNNFNNIVFENIEINGTGRASSGRYGLLIENNPGGYATYCNMTYANTGTNTSLGSYSFSSVGGCPGGCSLGSATVITSPATFGTCTGVTFTATSTAPSGSNIDYIDFLVNGVSVGSDYSSPYSMPWNAATAGKYQVTAVSHYTNPVATSASSVQTITVADALYSTGPTINWSEFKSYQLNVVSVGAANITNAADLSASFKTTRDATNLYIFVDVTDEDLRNDGGNAYDNDQVELYIDMGNTKSSTMGANDFAFNFIYNDPTPHGTTTTGVTLTQTIKTGGYTMLVKIPWSTLGGAPALGTFIGLEVQVDDDDGGGTRDSKITWNDVNDNASTNPSVYGTLQIASCNNPLPVELLSFTAEKNTNTVVLSWATATEKNNKEFVIERSGTASDWQAIGTVSGAGNSSSLKNYQFTDNEPLSGVSYYRLRQVDVDGKIVYSPVVVVQSTPSEESAITIAPNPFTETLNIRSTGASNALIKIYDLSGTVLFEVTTTNMDGLMIIQPVLRSGSYIMSVQTETSIEQFKIIKRD